MAEINEGMNLFDNKGIDNYPGNFIFSGRIKIICFALLLSVAISFVDTPKLKADCLFIPVCVTGTSVITTNFNQNIAPEFPPETQWLNTNRALKLEDLRGKVVLLNFWTYSRVSCHHVLPDLTSLKNKYSDELVVIGVHFGKFASEKDSDSIRQAIIRYGIGYPVANDFDMQIWRIYDIHAWPTLILIDPSGRIVNRYSGEDVFESFDKNIASIIRQFDSVGLLKRQPLNLTLETKKENDSLLSFPGGILADESSEKLFISDTGNNRIIIAGLDGSILDICGSGDRGILDGSFDIAKFNQPHGLALSNKMLYVADTGNHCIRAVNLLNRQVTTLAGNSRRGKSLNIRGKAHLAGLNSPWDLEVIDDKLFVTMAGTHQLYRIDLQNKTISLFAGSGFEDRLDGSQFKAALAQPSGLATDGKRLYFTDSQSSSVRWIDGRDNSVVTTIVGLGLFQFGDRDGRGPDALLQYPTGLTYYNDLLYVADTYNNKIKVIDLFISSSMTFLGNGTAGNADSPAPLFDEPGDVSYALGMLFIADTNNHLIRIADIKTAKVTTLELKTIPKD